MLESVVKSAEMKTSTNETKIGTLESRLANVEVNVEFIENQAKKMMEKGPPQNLGAGSNSLGDP